MNQAIREQPETATAHNPSYSPGLEGVIAGESALCQVDEGAAGLRYRGYAIGDLAEWSSFEEVAYLLLLGRLPTRSELDEFSTLLVRNRVLPDLAQRFIERLQPGLHPMDVLRTGISRCWVSPILTHRTDRMRQISANPCGW
ncbi:MAG: citrate/2-methylcitrate synthase [Nitrospira sp.]